MEAIVLAAGKGTRMRSDCPKVLHEIFGRPMLGYVLDTLAQLGVRRPKVVIGNGAEQVEVFLSKRKKETGRDYVTVLQREQKGTGHAVEMCREQLKNFSGDVLIWPGDMPLLEPETLKKFSLEHQKSGSDASVLSSLQLSPAGYGRILRAGGTFFAIIEELDATEEQRRIHEVNSGIYLFKAGLLFQALKKIRPSNAKSEFYLTDTIEVMSKEDRRLFAFPMAKPEEAQGINARKDLATGHRIMNKRTIETLMEEGVTFVSPEQTFVEPGAKIGRDTTVYPWCYIETGVTIGEGCQIGPFAKIRKGSVIGDGSIIGSFVEINRTKTGKKVYAKHLSYLGDALIGDGTNIGAGVITANFDGKNKHVTRIGKKALVGSNTVFVAPVMMGDNAKTGAGSVVTGGSRIRNAEIVAGVPARPLKRKKGK